jgi:hypothetical protein
MIMFLYKKTTNLRKSVFIYNYVIVNYPFYILEYPLLYNSNDMFFIK